MTLTELSLIGLSVVVSVVAYWIGHSDGYWKRANEDNLAAIDRLLKAKAKATGTPS